MKLLLVLRLRLLVKILLFSVAFLFLSSLFFVFDFNSISKSGIYTNTEDDKVCVFEYLYPGVKNSRVKKLQETLNSSEDTKVAKYGRGSKGNESTYFGFLTYNAVIRFQEKYASEILYPLGLTKGTGHIGPLTRTKLKKVCMLAISNDLRDERALAIGENGERIKRKQLPLETKVSFQEFFYQDITEFKKGEWLTLGVVLLSLSFNFILWGFFGFVRILHESLVYPFRRDRTDLNKNSIREEEVAVITSAHNEELVIGDMLNAVVKIIKKENVFVVSDGSTDNTPNIVRELGFSLLEFNPGKGKAGALEAGIKHFGLADRFKALIILDADTRLRYDYLKNCLPFFNDSKVVAVAGYAATIWNPKEQSWRQTLFLSHRDRVYFLMQRILKFGQAWKHANVTSIIPGFASTYRTSIFRQINMNPPGLVIEDYNVTFEIHHRRLGRIVHTPKVVAYTQDPDNFRDYFRQVKRWNLGLFQTVRLHGFWASKFWMSLSLTLLEVFLSSLIFFLVPVLFIISTLLLMADALFYDFFIFSFFPNFMQFYHFLLILLILIWSFDYIITLIVALLQKRPEYLLTGIFFPIIRFFDSVAILFAIPKAYLTKSNGSWISPTRRRN